MTTLAADIVAQELGTWKRKPRAPTYRAFAATIRLPGGRFVGELYNPSSDPVQSYVIDQLDSGQWERIYWGGSPQVAAKTTVGVMLTALRNAIGCGLMVGYGLPTLQDLDKAWATKIKPAIKKSGYGNRMPTQGPGAREGRGPTLQFVDPDDGAPLGGLVFLAGGAYGDTAGAVIVDEVDQFRAADGTPQWSQLEDIFSRADSYGRKALRIAVGTLESDDQSIILPLIDTQGTGTRCSQECPHCGTYQVVQRAQIVYSFALQGQPGAQSVDEEAVRESARIVCTRCAAGWTERDRLQSLVRCRFPHRGQTVTDRGEIVGEAPRTSRLGLLTPAWTSTIADLREIALKHAHARLLQETTHNPAAMRKWVRYQACETFQEVTGDVPRTTDMQLADRSAGQGYERGDIPPDAQVVTVGADTGKREAWWLSLAVAPDRRWWIVDWSVKETASARGEPTPDEQRDMLSRLEERAGRCGRATDRGIDCGYNTDLVTGWAKENGWRMIRGDQRPTGTRHPGSPLPSWADDRRQANGQRWLFLDGAELKKEIHRSLARPVGSPGAGHLPRDQAARDWLIRHLTGETWDPAKGKWVRIRPDNHLLDCLVYALALAIIALQKGADRNEKEAEPSAPAAGWVDEIRTDHGSSWL